MPRSSRRRSTPVSPAKSRTETTPPRQTGKTTRTRTREPSVSAPISAEPIRRALDAVEEESDTIHVRERSTTRGDKLPGGNSAAQQDSQQPSTSRRVASIRASVHNDIARAEVGIQQTIKHLTELDFRADELLAQVDLYTPEQLLDHFSDHKSRVWDEFSEDAVRLERQRQYYCNDTDLLQINALVEQLAAEGLPTDGAGQVYMKANLALFFYRLIEAHEVELHNLLYTLSSSQTFPEMFSLIVTPSTADTVSYDDDFRNQTAILGLSILTQYFISRVKRNARSSKFDYLGALQDVFFEDGITVRDVSLGNISEDHEKAYITLVRKTTTDIERVISRKSKTAANLAALEKRYPWTDFMANALTWVKARAEQIKDGIQQAGGVRAIKHGLQRSQVQPSSTVKRKKPHASRADEEFVGKVSFLKNIDETLNAGEAELQQARAEYGEPQSDAEAEVNIDNEPSKEVEVPARSDRVLREIIPSAIPESPRAQNQLQDVSQEQDQDQSILVNDDEVEEEIPDSAQSPSVHSVIKPTPATTTVLRNLQRQAKEGNKENSPPPRLLPTTGRQTTTVPTSSAAPAQTQSSNKGKRRRDDNDSEDSEDDEDDFESDKRQTKHIRPEGSRKALPTRHDQPTSSNAYLADTVEPTDDHPPPSRRPNPQPPSSTQPPPNRDHDRIRSTSSQPQPHTRIPSSTAPPPSSYEAYQHAQRTARSNTAFATSLPRPPQTRRPWTAPEIERLLYLMRQYGCAWSAIKKADQNMDVPQLLERTQVQLKDKARNMKLDFLKAELDLPGELVGVTISKGHKEMLKGMNIAFPGEEFEE